MKYLSVAAVFAMAVYGAAKIFSDGQPLSLTRGAILVLIGAAICFSIIGHAEKKG
jgi:uncharacterized membrane protein YGL010W